MARMRYVSENVKTAVRPFAAFFGVFILYFLLRRLPYIGNAMMGAEAFVARMGASVGQSISRIVASDDSLSALLKKSQENVTLLARDSVEFSRLQAENTELKNLLSYKEGATRASLTARIIARSLPEDESTVVLDKGKKDGVAEGSTVVVGQGVVFGIVSSVTETTSLVRLLSSTESKIPSQILGKKKTIGLLEGREGAVLTMQFVPREAGIARGDVVVTSGLEGRIPEGLLLGTVTEVVDMQSAPFEEALVEPLENPLDWSYVLILAPTVL
jgi:rod shape-determining protein MreC